MKKALVAEAWRTASACTANRIFSAPAYPLLKDSGFW
jgi:hypothetical protein